MAFQPGAVWTFQTGWSPYAARLRSIVRGALAKRSDQVKARAPVRWRRTASPFLLLFSAHLIVALFYRQVLGINIESNPRSRPWDWFWQTVPADLLRVEAFSSIWHLHSQPPLFNSFASIFFKLAPDSALQWMHLANILMGSALSGMLYLVLFTGTQSRRFSIWAGALLLLNPSLYLYEAYILYDLLTAFLIVLSIWLLARHSVTRNDHYLPAFVLAVNLLLLTRSSFHILFLIPAIFIGALAARRWKYFAAVSILISGLSVGWVLKNYTMFGVFGSSSWMGSSIWKIVSANYEQEELQQLMRQGLIPAEVLRVPVFSPPSAYVSAGPERQSDVPVLSRDDRHNIRYIDISREYLTASFQLLRHDPLHYVKNVSQAYLLFCQSSSEYVQLRVNAQRIRVHENLWAESMHGRRAVRALGLHGATFVVFLLPLAVGYYVWSVLATGRPPPIGILNRLRADYVFAYLFVVVVYGSAVSVMLEFGENHRLRFMVEQPTWAFVVSIGYRFCQVAPKAWSRRAPSRTDVVKSRA